ncbi:MAG: permease [Dehalococcoidales bacterium]|nr:MAG: permease [Dehalococcoidales bacterium]
MLAKIKGLLKKIDGTLVFLGALVLVAVIAAQVIGGGDKILDGLERAGSLFESVWLRLILGFTLGGMIRLLIPSAVIARWLGHASGIRGLLIGSYIAIIMPGGPYVTMPVIAAIYSAGAGIGPIIALLTGRALLGVQMLIVWQIPFLGVEISLARYIACLVLPPIAGMVGAAVYKLLFGPPPVMGEIGGQTTDADLSSDTTDDASNDSENEV